MVDINTEIQSLNSLRSIQAGLLRLNWLAAATRFEIAMRRHAWALKAGFNPDQPRDDRGQWTDEGGGNGGNTDQSNGKTDTVQVAADNQRQNKTVRDIVVRLGLNKDQAQALHRVISGQGLGYHQILQIAIDMFGK